MKLLAATFLGILGLTAAAADLPPLNSPPTADFYAGKFVWADLFTVDPPRAAKFYADLFGWTATTVERVTASGPHAYVVMAMGDRPVCGIKRRPLLDQDQAHARWVGYVSVPDVARALAAVKAGGGRVISRLKDLPNRGTQAIFADAEGATLGLIHSRSGDPGEFLPEPGDWTWAELFARDPAAAGRFYRDVAGYDCMPDHRTDRPNSFILVSGGYSRASVSVVPDRPKAHPVWLLFVRVRDVKDAVARATSLGGRVLVPPSASPAEYWRAVITDPTGAHVGVVQFEDSSPTPKQP